MESKMRVAILLLCLLNTGIILYPLLELAYCTEPELGYVQWTMVQLDILEATTMCPTYASTAMAIMMNVAVLISGAIMGYISRKMKLLERKKVDTRPLWMILDEEMLNEALRGIQHQPSQEGYLLKCSSLLDRDVERGFGRGIL